MLAIDKTGTLTDGRPALAAADIGIAMGTGSDVAIETAGVTLFTGEFAGTVRACRLSRATRRSIRPNQFLAFFCSAAGIPIAPTTIDKPGAVGNLCGGFTISRHAAMRPNLPGESNGYRGHNRPQGWRQ